MLSRTSWEWAAEGNAAEARNIATRSAAFFIIKSAMLGEPSLAGLGSRRVSTVSRCGRKRQALHAPADEKRNAIP